MPISYKNIPFSHNAPDRKRKKVEVSEPYSSIKEIEPPFMLEIRYSYLEEFETMIEQSSWTRQEKDVAIMNVRGFYSMLRQKASTPA